METVLEAGVGVVGLLLLLFVAVVPRLVTLGATPTRVEPGRDMEDFPRMEEVREVVEIDL